MISWDARGEMPWVEMSLKSRWKGAEGNTQELTVNGLMLLWEGGDCVRVRVGCEMKL